MRRSLYVISLLMLSLSGRVAAQDPCDNYDMIQDSVEDLSSEAVFAIPMAPNLKSRDIRRSRQLTREALRMAYALKNGRSCPDYYGIEMSIAELEERLGNFNTAREVLVSYIHERCPDFDNVDTDCRIETDVFEALIRTSAAIQSVYRQVRKHKGAIGVCGTTHPLESYSNVLHVASTLLEDFGAIYCIRYLNTVGIALNGEDLLTLDYNNSLFARRDSLDFGRPRLSDVWASIYNLAVHALLDLDTRDALITEYLNSPVIPTESVFLHYDTFSFASGYEAKFMITVKGLKLFLCDFQTHDGKEHLLIVDQKALIEKSEFLEKLRAVE